METPNKSIEALISLSWSLLGQKSPNPTVDRDVKAKYTEIIALS